MSPFDGHIRSLELFLVMTQQNSCEILAICLAASNTLLKAPESKLKQQIKASSNKAREEEGGGKSMKTMSVSGVYLFWQGQATALTNAVLKMPSGTYGWKNHVQLRDWKCVTFYSINSACRVMHVICVVLVSLFLCISMHIYWSILRLLAYFLSVMLYSMYSLH